MAAVFAGKVTTVVSRALRRGGGTALPGLIAARVDPTVTRDLAQQLAGGSIVVTGTNGKTTTSRLLASILADAGFLPLRNQSGSNLMRGVTASLVQQAGLLGNLRSHTRAVGLFEVDEAAFPGVIQALQPRRLLLLNLFRDQLDRYGEVATVARLWSAALQHPAYDGRLFVNGDDPILTETATVFNGTPTFFGIDSAEGGSHELDHASDVKTCPHCGSPIEYERVFLGHLGHYSCGTCGLHRPNVAVLADGVRLLGVRGSEFTLTVLGEQVAVALPLPGMYNVYNALAAAAVASDLGVAPADIARSLGEVTAAFGRMERIEVDGREVYIALAKNPAGLNQVMRTALEDGEPLHLLFMLSDNTADGHDVSWIWDADVELLAGFVDSAVFAGTRGPDMALRFKYAAALPVAEPLRWAVSEETESALRQAIDWTPVSGRLFIVPTYTALLDVRGVLARLGHVRPYWEE